MNRHNRRKAVEAGKEEEAEHYRKALDASLVRVNTLLHLLRLKLDPDDPERPRDKEIWNLIVHLDRMEEDQFDSLELYEDTFLAELEPLHKAVRAKLAGEWKRVERLE